VRLRIDWFGSRAAAIILYRRRKPPVGRAQNAL